MPIFISYSLGFRFWNFRYYLLFYEGYFSCAIIPLLRNPLWEKMSWYTALKIKPVLSIYQVTVRSLRYRPLSYAQRAVAWSSRYLFLPLALVNEKWLCYSTFTVGSTGIWSSQRLSVCLGRPRINALETKYHAQLTRRVIPDDKNY